MSRQEEATLLLKIKQTGKEALDNVGKSFKDIVKQAALVGAAIAGVGIAVGKLVLDASKFGEVKKAFTSLVESQGKDAQVMIKNMQTATKGTIAEMDLMKAANNALLLGLPIDKFDDMLTVAVSASKATGESMEFMLSSIVTGLGRGSKLILDNLGIMVDTNAAYEKYAKILGVTADKLSDAQKKQAFINEAMRIGLENAKKLGDSTESLNDKYNRLIANSKNAAISLGQDLTPAMAHVLDWSEDLVGNETKGLTSVGRVLVWIKDAAVGTIKFLSILATSTVDAFTDVGNVFSALFSGDVTENFLVNLIRGFPKALKVMEANAEKSKERWKKLWEGFGDDAEEGLTKKLPEAGKKSGEETAKNFEQGFNQYADISTMFNVFTEGAADAGKKAAIMTAEFFNPKSGGLKNAAKAGIALFAETILPGIGGAIGEVFEFLAMETEEFAATLDQLFSVEFVRNVLQNLAILFAKIDELQINVFNSLIEMLPELMPDMIAAIIKSIIVGSPRIVMTLIEVFGSINTWKEIGQGIRDGIVQGLKESFKTSFTDVISWFEEKWKAMTGKLRIQSSDIINFTSFGNNLQSQLNSLNWFSNIEAEWDKIKDKFKITIPGVGGGGGSFVDKAVGFVSSGGGLWANGGEIPGYASGGILRDNQLIGAQSGEFMVNRNSAQENLPLLNAINQSNGPYQGGGGGGGGNNISIVVNGGFLGDEVSAREFAVAVDYELLKLRQSNGSVAFDSGVV